MLETPTTTQNPVLAESAASRLRAEIQKNVVEASALDEIQDQLYKKIFDQLNGESMASLKNTRREMAVLNLATGWFNLYTSDLRILGGSFDAARLKSAAEYVYDAFSPEGNDKAAMAKMVLMIMLGFPYKNDYLVEDV